MSRVIKSDKERADLTYYGFISMIDASTFGELVHPYHRGLGETGELLRSKSAALAVVAFSLDVLLVRFYLKFTL